MNVNNFFHDLFAVDLQYELFSVDKFQVLKVTAIVNYRKYYYVYGQFLVQMIENTRIEKKKGRNRSNCSL
jgi:hypothetical protein